MNDTLAPVTAFLYVMDGSMRPRRLDRLQNVDETIKFSLSITDELERIRRADSQLLGLAKLSRLS